MTSWNDILYQYQFQTTFYEEHSDPSDLTNYFVEIIPKYPLPAFDQNSICLVVHSYHNLLLNILPSDDIRYDFLVSVCFTYFSSQHTGRQLIYLSTLHSFLALYNHSDFLIGRAHCMSQCDICSGKDNIHHSKVTTTLHNFRSSYSSIDTFRFQPFVRDFETDHFLT